MTRNQPPAILPPNFTRLDGRDFVILWSLIFLGVAIFILDWQTRIITTSLICSLIVYAFYKLAVRPVHPVCLRAFLKDLRVGTHRGMASDAPENTLAAFALSKRMGADSIEFDLEMTKDRVAIIIHDETVDRTTDGKGSVCDMTLEEIRRLNAASKFDGSTAKFPAEPVPTFEETVDLLLKLETKFFIDVKNPDQKIVDTIVEMYRKRDALYLSAAVCSFFPQVIYRVKRADWRIICGYTWRPGYFTHKDYDRHELYHEGWLRNKALHWLEELYVWSVHRFYWKITGASLFLTDEHCVSEEYVKIWRRRGMEVVAWTVNDYHQKLYYLHTLKVPFLTDKLSDLQDHLKHSRMPNHDYSVVNIGPNSCHLCHA